VAHLNRDSEKLLARVKKIRGQLNAAETGIAGGDDCSDVLMTLASCRGAMNALLVEILEGHIRGHVLDPGARPDSKRAQATNELIDVIRTYLK
jgi:FrmR/RcnR family transcriptional regulator, repressor of frmRAB operon